MKAVNKKCKIWESLKKRSKKFWGCKILQITLFYYSLRLFTKSLQLFLLMKLKVSQLNEKKEKKLMLEVCKDMSESLCLQNQMSWLLFVIITEFLLRLFIF